MKKVLNMNYEIEKTIPSQARTSKKENAITPVLFDDAMIREHSALMATSGGGKTELLLNGWIHSTIARGAGVFAVFGKADNAMVQRVQSICASYNRLSDLIVLDFNQDKKGKFNSNSINIFELGSPKDIITMFLSIANLEGKDDGGWSGKAKLYLSSLLRVVLLLQEANFFVDVNRIDDIFESRNNKFEEYQKHITKLDYFGFNRLLNETDLLLKFLMIFDEIYAKDRLEINRKLYEKNTNLINENFEKNNQVARLDRNIKNQFHYELKSVVISFSTVPDWDSLVEIYKTGINTENQKIVGIEAVMAKYPRTSGTFYDLEASRGLLDKLENFFNSFAPILKNNHSDLNLLDAIDSNRIVIVNLPGQNKIYSPVLAELIVSVLNLLAERRGKDYVPDTTTLVVLDEINSWLKSKNNQSYQIGDLLSVIRGLHMGAVLSFQSDIRETMGSVDNSQIIANVKTIISLKLEDTELIKLLNSKVEKVEKIVLDESLKRDKNSKKSENDANTRINKSEEDFFKPAMLNEIKNGEGFIIRNSKAQPFMSKYMVQKSLYKTQKDDVMLNRFVGIESIFEKQKELNIKGL